VSGTLLLRRPHRKTEGKYLGRSRSATSPYRYAEGTGGERLPRYQLLRTPVALPRSAKAGESGNLPWSIGGTSHSRRTEILGFACPRRVAFQYPALHTAGQIVALDEIEPATSPGQVATKV
jgi:hypothetical protein